MGTREAKDELANKLKIRCTSPLNLREKLWLFRCVVAKIIMRWSGDIFNRRGENSTNSFSHFSPSFPLRCFVSPDWQLVIIIHIYRSLFPSRRLLVITRLDSDQTSCLCSTWCTEAKNARPPSPSHDIPRVSLEDRQHLTRGQETRDTSLRGAQ